MNERRTRLMYEVRRLHRRGESVRAIARTLRINRRTVTRLLREVEERRATGDDAIARLELQRRAPRPSKLDAYADFIAELIGRYPNIRATRLHEELCGQGFNGGYTIVRQVHKDAGPVKKLYVTDRYLLSNCGENGRGGGFQNLCSYLKTLSLGDHVALAIPPDLKKVKAHAGRWVEAIRKEFSVMNVQRYSAMLRFHDRFYIA